ncbi:hypothetical protein N8Z37_04870 [Octadecabacter sp.]|nr:hypothetical protein [Octadecabacter sp.]
MKKPTKRSVNFNAASPSWQTDFNLNDLPNLTPSFPEQDGDLLIGSDGRPTGIYVAAATPKRTWQDMPVATDEYVAFVNDRSAWENDPIISSPSPASNGPTSNFRQRLIQSESSGRSDAEITIADGRRFVGQLQFGQARLQDYQRASGTSFTQDQFVADETLQARVADWHFADIDRAIDGLGDATDGYDRDGLRAVAHLGGIGGMRRFVVTDREYNPSDELGTSLQDYYSKFSEPRGDGGQTDGS